MKFVKTGIIDKKFARILSDLLNARKESDYNPLSWFEKDDAEEFYVKAEEFVKKMEEKLIELKKSDISS